MRISKEREILMKEVFEKDNYKEIFIELEDGQVMTALINGKIGWLMYLRYEGDAGFSSRSSDKQETGVETFMFSNGEVDNFPLSWTIPIEKIYKAIEYSEVNKEKPPFILWNED